jgi:glycine cleavage system aminomethyltransferase T
MERVTQSVYANQMKLSQMLVDFAISFWVVEPTAPEVEENNPGTIGSVTVVHMSPQLGKRLAVALAEAIADYETDHGPIPEKSDAGDENQDTEHPENAH